MRKTSDSELRKLLKQYDFYKVEEMYWMGLINLSSKQIDYLLEEKRKYNESKKRTNKNELFSNI